MAAYAALVSLMNTTEQIQNYPRLSTCLDKYQVESLGENVGFFLDFIERYNCHGGSREAEDLEREIASAAQAAEDVIESHIVDQILAGSHERSLSCLFDLQKVMLDMGFIKEKVIKVKEERAFEEKQPTFSMSAVSSRPLTTGKTSMVGFEDELRQLVDVLTGQQSDRQIISIIGMGGIGKTTLAKSVYEDMVIMRHFDLRAWATISQEYNVTKILSELLSCKEKSTSEISEITDDELGEELYKELSGRRYLVILDDMWSLDVWDKIKFFFPDHGDRSRIVITSRISNIAFHFTSFSLVMNFLDEDKSWKLFCDKAFGEDDCPSELEGFGKKIVKKCKGLPLSIVVMGGHLGKSSRTNEYWENVVNDINSILGGEDEQRMNILSLSYSHLPACLKPCFLYMGIFLEDEEIGVSTLIKLWVAEGFLKPSEAQSLEEIAEVYLKDLIDRNLLLGHEWSRNGRKIKTCKIHDLLRDLCLSVAKKEKFRCALEWPPQPSRKSCSFDFRLRKIQFVDHQELGKSDVGCLETKFEQVNLRYLDRYFSREGFPENIFPLEALPRVYVHSSVFLLWNLQTLIITDYIVRFIAPSEIWEMSQLRHLLIRSRICLPDPPPSDQQDDFVLRNLRTLLTVENFSLSEEVCKRIPNIKRLHLFYDGEAHSNSYYCLHNLGSFKELRSLTCNFDKVSNWREFAVNLPFLSSLQKLSLSSPSLNWEDLTMIGLSLPHLEVLKLSYRDSSAVGQFEGEFPCLKSLTIRGGYNFNHWNVDVSHFPVLENLTLTGLGELPDIPSDIGEIQTLRCIELIGCSTSAAVSAMRMLVEQEIYGNDDLQVHVWFFGQEPKERFWEIVQEEDLTSNNLFLN